MGKRKAKTRREYLTRQAIDPSDGTEYDILISYNRIQGLGRISRGHTMECAYNMPYVLLHPTAIFEGLCQEEDEDGRGVGWRCYCGSPECRYLKDGTPEERKPKRVFVVSINHEKVAYNWRWTKCSEDDEKLPMGHGTRFKRRLL